MFSRTLRPYIHKCKKRFRTAAKGNESVRFNDTCYSSARCQLNFRILSQCGNSSFANLYHATTLTSSFSTTICSSSFHVPKYNLPQWTQYLPSTCMRDFCAAQCKTFFPYARTISVLLCLFAVTDKVRPVLLFHGVSSLKVLLGAFPKL